MRNPIPYITLLLLTLVLAACGGQTGASTDVTGSWSGQLSGPSGSAPFSMQLTQSGTNVEGTLNLEGEIPISGTVVGNVLTLGVEAEDGSIRIDGSVSGDSMQGTMTFTSGSDTAVLNLTATR
jgi:hypothetical protein